MTVGIDYLGISEFDWSAPDGRGNATEYELIWFKARETH